MHQLCWAWLQGHFSQGAAHHSHLRGSLCWVLLSGLPGSNPSRSTPGPCGSPRGMERSLGAFSGVFERLLALASQSSTCSHAPGLQHRKRAGVRAGVRAALSHCGPDMRDPLLRGVNNALIEAAEHLLCTRSEQSLGSSCLFLSPVVGSCA